MAEAYDILKKEEANDTYRTIVSDLLIRAWSMMTQDIIDIPSKIKTEIMMGKCIFGETPNPAVQVFMECAFEEYKAVPKYKHRAIDTVIRDICELYHDDIKGSDTTYTEPNEHTHSIDNRSLLDIIDEYVEFKSKIDDVSPETAAEIDRLANMTDEEFEAEMNKPDEEDEEEEETEEVDTPITLHDFETLSVAELIAKYGSHDTAKCLIDADGGEEKLMQSADLDLFDTEDQKLLTKEFGITQDAPNTEEYNKDYDIPDEKLYPQE